MSEVRFVRIRGRIVPIKSKDDKLVTKGARVGAGVGAAVGTAVGVANIAKIAQHTNLSSRGAAMAANIFGVAHIAGSAAWTALGGAIIGGLSLLGARKPAHLIRAAFHASEGAGYGALIGASLRKKK